MTVAVADLAQVVAPSDREDALTILGRQDATRLQDLVPVRHERMAATPFTFYRGAAAVMAADLAATPDSGIRTQLCGDAHLSNFGMFLSPERTMVFDVNDFDETHPGPFEWDVKRLAGSIVVAAQQNGLDDVTARSCAKAAAKAYRKSMVASASKTGLDCWYARVDAEDVLTDIGDRFDTSATEKVQKTLNKARHRNSEQALSKLTYFDLTGAHIKSDPPLLVPSEEVMTSMSRDELRDVFTKAFDDYATTVPPHVAALLHQYELVETARKVVGVGSVGTRCWIALFSGPGPKDPLFLQVKEAQQSVLAPYVKRADGEPFEFDNEGHRVVFGQQLMQASSDILLGWMSRSELGDRPTDFYVRQLRDGKGSVVIEALGDDSMKYYAKLCGEVLAQAHARTAPRAEIAAFLSDAGKTFDRAMADFAIDYSDLNVSDHQRLVDAIAAGNVTSASL